MTRDELIAVVELCPLCGVKALENPTTQAEAINGMREHITLVHDSETLAMFNRLAAKCFPGQGL